MLKIRSMQNQQDCINSFNDFTIVYKMELYCEQQYKRSIIQSSLSIGSLLGLIIMNIVSDLKGRKTALLIDLCLGVTSSLLTYIGATMQTTPLLVFASIMSGFSGYSMIIISYIMLGDICEESLRQKSSVYINMFISLGTSSFFVLNKWCNQWDVILIFFMILPLIAITAISYFIVEQSPNYCLLQLKDQDSCIQSLINIAKINKKTYVEAERIKFLVNKINKKSSSHTSITAQQSIFKALTKWKYLKIIVILSIVESGGNLCFYGIQYAINDIGYSFGVNSLVLGLTQIVTTIIVGQYVPQMPRKKTLAIVYGLTPVFTMFFIFDFVRASPFLCTIVIILMRIMTTTGYFMVVMFQTQSFPMQIQSIGAGSIQAFAQFGAVIAPILNAFSINHGFPKVSVMGFTMFLCLLPLVFVDQSSSLKTNSNQVRYQDQRQVQSQAPKYFYK